MPGKDDRAERSILRARPSAGPIAGAIFAVVFAALAAVIALAQTGWPVDHFAAGSPAPITVRAPHFVALAAGSVDLSDGGVVVGRGQILGEGSAALARDVILAGPHGLGAYLFYTAAFALLALLVTTALRRSRRGHLLRAHLVLFAATLVLAGAAKLGLLATPMSTLVVPAAALALLAAAALDVIAGLAIGLLSAAVLGLIGPFDPGVVAVLAVQACLPVAVLGRRRRPGPTRLALAGLAGAAGAGLAYPLLHYFSRGSLPLAELATPLYSAWLAAILGGVVGGLVAAALLPLFLRSLGELSRARLVALEDLGHPLLEQIAEKAPGTWQHSLAMANMAEIAARSIGADGRLVRVGAYFHDLGKSLQPKYFVENLGGGEPSPHDKLAPEVSCDAIFSHVTEGVRVARRAGLPERVVDFMHMHHGDGRLEYFWSKCQETGNPKKLGEADFRYPGVRPQSVETAILAICDAVEAASRTLQKPDEQAVRSLVQHIVYGKLHLGQLDDSGLTMSELRRISDSLVETIAHAHHARIEYPWQREADSGALETVAGRPAQRSTAERLIAEPPLDSLDAPRAMWRERAARLSLGVLPTEEMSHGDEAMADTAAAPRPAAADHTRDLRTRKAELEILDDDPGRHSAIERLETDTDSLEAWQSALESAADASALAPLVPPAPRRKRSTIDLDGGAARPQRADSQDEPLAPGTMVLGPPPATHPERRPPTADDDTVVRRVPVPAAAVRPEERATRPRPAQRVPTAAYPSDDEDPARRRPDES